MEIAKYEGKDQALDAASIYFEKLLEKSFNLFERKGANTLLLLSGGSSLSIIKRVSDTYLGKFLTISVLDERFSKDSDVNNFAQLSKTQFYSWSQDAGCNFIDTRVKEEEDLHTSADSFERRLKIWIEENPYGKIIATIGMGSDGHVAGIMPYPDDSEKFNNLFNFKRRWVVGYDAGDKDKYPERITTTLPFIRQIENAVVFISGEEKRSAFQRLIAPEGSLNETPVRIITKLENVHVFTDIK